MYTKSNTLESNTIITRTSSSPRRPTILNPPRLLAKTQHRIHATEDGRTASSGMGRRLVIGGAASFGFMLIMMELGHGKAWALGPEGPLMEEFWENVRRYALYALTVSTGVLYSVFQPIYELLKNPISAVLVIVIIGGTFFIGSQILSAMVGLSDFDYQYAY
ncbi:hypothetical protein vseg_011610 [Gypsophila vaccaria]